MTSLLQVENNWLRSTEEVIVRRSLGESQGYWAGAPSVWFDPEEARFYLYYRLRRPVGQGRGNEARIAVSRDGLDFEDIWSIRQDQLASPSIERGWLVHDAADWVLFLSYVNGETNRWQIDRLKAESVSALSAAHRETVLDTTQAPAHAVKDPVIQKVGPLWYMYVSYAPLDLLGESTDQQLHRSGDVFTTGSVRSHTGLAVSADGVHFSWQGEVLASSQDGWDSLVSRVTGLLPAGNLYIAFYDGAASLGENYEERGGLAVTADLHTFHKIRFPNALFQSAFGSARYFCPVVTPTGTYVYYEAASPQGSHYLCVRRLEA
jgi:hypothetical protein